MLMEVLDFWVILVVRYMEHHRQWLTVVLVKVMLQLLVNSQCLVTLLLMVTCLFWVLLTSAVMCQLLVLYVLTDNVLVDVVTDVINLNFKIL